MASALRQPLKGFLNLGPVTSDSFPQQPASAASPAESAPKTGIARRSSSVSTVNSVGSGQQRFLKLGPVHFGEHQDPENKDDWSAITE